MACFHRDIIGQIIPSIIPNTRGNGRCDYILNIASNSLVDEARIPFEESLVVPLGLASGKQGNTRSHTKPLNQQRSSKKPSVHDPEHHVPKNLGKWYRCAQ